MAGVERDEQGALEWSVWTPGPRVAVALGLLGLVLVGGATWALLRDPVGVALQVAAQVGVYVLVARFAGDGQERVRRVRLRDDGVAEVERGRRGVRLLEADDVERAVLAYRDSVSLVVRPDVDEVLVPRASQRQDLRRVRAWLQRHQSCPQR